MPAGVEQINGIELGDGSDERAQVSGGGDRAGGSRGRQGRRDGLLRGDLETNSSAKFQTEMHKPDQRRVV